MTRGQDGVQVCPYCGRPLHWVPLRWFGRGAFECDHCGDFPDLAETTIRIPKVPAAADRLSRALPRKHDGRPLVLLVDDSAEYRDLYALMLEQTASVITASHGEDAIAIASSEPLDAIVLDVMMPGMDGWQTCERLKANPLTSGIPVIMLTAFDGLDVPARAERVGAAAVLIKPCPVERLAIAIEAAVQKKFGRTRRWTRKPVTSALPVRVDDIPAHILNLSYGGLCVEVEQPAVIPVSFDVVVPASAVAVHADAVWTSQLDAGWLCGAEIAQASDGWRHLVDAIA